MGVPVMGRSKSPSRPRVAALKPVALSDRVGIEGTGAHLRSDRLLNGRAAYRDDAVDCSAEVN